MWALELFLGLCAPIILGVKGGLHLVILNCVHVSKLLLTHTNFI